MSKYIICKCTCISEREINYCITVCLFCLLYPGIYVAEDIAVEDGVISTNIEYIHLHKTIRGIHHEL